MGRKLTENALSAICTALQQSFHWIKQKGKAMALAVYLAKEKGIKAKTSKAGSTETIGKKD